MTVDEAKALAEENEYDTEPNDEGDIEQRPGKLSDYIPSPYKNDEAARAANNGALPPDLSLMVKARHGGCDYIFSLLTGYPEEPPAGATVQSGLNFNPYFPGTGIAMARVLYDGLVEYEDETPASTSQMAKDVTEFLNWCAEPEADDRKRMGWKVIAISSVLFGLSVWVKRYVQELSQRWISANSFLDTSGPQSRQERSCTSHLPHLERDIQCRTVDEDNLEGVEWSALSRRAVKHKDITLKTLVGSVQSISGLSCVLYQNALSSFSLQCGTTEAVLEGLTIG